MNNYKRLEVWKVAIDLVSEVYKLSKKLPKEEMFALTSQIKRCSVSIASNIAEGAGRNGRKEFVNFLGIASGSCCELDTQLLIAQNLGFLQSDDLTLALEKLVHIQRMNINLIRKLKAQA
jgi:four helix bundle protein